MKTPFEIALGIFFPGPSRIITFVPRPISCQIGCSARLSLKELEKRLDLTAMRVGGVLALLALNK